MEDVQFPHTTTASRDRSSLRVLLVDDSPANTKLGMSLLKRLGYDVAAAGNGEECLTTLTHSTFDLVLMDIEMPVMNGVAAMREIRRQERRTGFHLPIIAFTALSSLMEKEYFLEKGFDGHVPKPIDVQQLLFEMKRVCRLNSSDRGKE